MKGHPAGGYSPFESFYLEINREWSSKTEIDIVFGMPIRLHRSDTRVKPNRGKIAVSRGPIVYCIEDIDNPSAMIPDAKLDAGFTIDTAGPHGAFEEVVSLRTKDSNGNPLTFIPYYCWANRAPSKMQVWVEEADQSALQKV